MKHLKKAIIKEHQERLKGWLEDMKTEEGLNKVLQRFGKQYVKNPKEKLTNYIINKIGREQEVELNKIDSAYLAEDFNSSLVITLEWKKSAMWGSNPKAHTNFGFEGSSIGGCGYCKTSTATAQALNSHLPLLKMLYLRKNKELGNLKEFYTEQNGFKGNSQQHINAEVLGYGSGYGVIPHFEGGVGVNCHERIVEKLGFKMQCVTDTPNTNVYTIDKI